MGLGGGGEEGEGRGGDCKKKGRENIKGAKGEFLRSEEGFSEDREKGVRESDKKSRYKKERKL